MVESLTELATNRDFFLKIFLVWHNGPLGTGAVSDAFVCSKDPCSTTELPHPSLI